MTAQEVRQIIKDKVDGIWVAEHTAEGHFYRNTKTNKLVPSITTKQKIINKPHLLDWAIKRGIEWLEEHDRFSKLQTLERSTYLRGAQEAHTEERDEAAGDGTLAHAVIESYIKFWIEKGHPPADIKKGFKEGASTRAIAGARAAEVLFKTEPIIPVATELLVGNEELNSAGTLDFLCLYDGELAILDWKLTNAIDDGYAAQVSAYKGMFEDMTGLEVKRIRIYQLSKNYDKFTAYRVNLPREAYRAMKGLSKYYDWKENGKKKVEKDVIKINLTTDYGRTKARTISRTPNPGATYQGENRGDIAPSESGSERVAERDGVASVTG